MIFHRTLPDCDPGDRSVMGAIFCIADIVEGGASFRAAFLPFPFARRCRLRQRRAKTKTPRRPAGTARQKMPSIEAMGGRPVAARPNDQAARGRSGEHTSELQPLMRLSYAVLCLKKKYNLNTTHITYIQAYT